MSVRIKKKSATTPLKLAIQRVLKKNGNILVEVDGKQYREGDLVQDDKGCYFKIIAVKIIKSNQKRAAVVRLINGGGSGIVKVDNFVEQ